MINIKSEILAKRKKNNEKAEVYNSVVKEYIEQVKDVLVYNGHLKVDYCEKEDGLLKIDVVSNNERTKYHFSYNDIKRYLYLNNDDVLNKNMIENKLKDFVIHIAEKENIEIKEVIDGDCDVKYEFKLKKLNYCNIENTISKDNIYTFNTIDDVLNFIKHINIYTNEDRLYYGDYFLDIDLTNDEQVIREYIEDYIKDVEKFERAKTLDKNKNNIKPIDFKALINREEDKKKVIYGLFDSILETNLEGIRNALDDKYVVNIQYSKSKANTLCIIDTDVLNRVCCIEYERVNPHKSFEDYTKEEIEEYLQRIVVAFAMEYDK